MNDRDVTDHPFDDAFDGLMRSSAPRVPATAEYRREFRAILQQEMLRRRGGRRTRRVLVSCAVIVGLVFVSNLALVISGAFDLRPTGRMINGKPIFESTAGDYRINGFDLDERSIAEQQRILETIYAKRAAGDRELIDVTGWTVAGHSLIVGRYRYIVDGEVLEFADDGIVPPRSAIEQVSEFITSHNTELQRRIRAGEVDVLPHETVVIGGETVEVAKWSCRFPGWGEIVYWSSDFDP